MVATRDSEEPPTVKIERDEWSDPLIALQVESFIDYVNEANRSHLASIEDVEVLAEYLCEWSRNLLNRMFGRTTHDEVVQVQSVFEFAADAVDRWALNFPQSNTDRKKTDAFSKHIRERTGVRFVR